MNTVGGMRSVWTVTEARARLSQLLHQAEKEGPQRIGAEKMFVVIPEHMWDARSSSPVPMGCWLVENMPRGYELELPDRASTREVPFTGRDSDNE